MTCQARWFVSAGSAWSVRLSSRTVAVCRSTVITSRGAPAQVCLAPAGSSVRQMLLAHRALDLGGAVEAAELGGVGSALEAHLPDVPADPERHADHPQQHLAADEGVD